MSDGISAPFIRYPIGTSLMMAGILFVGLVAYPLLPVAPLPQVDFPTIQVAASLPGGSPETMASSVAQPLERQFAQIPGIAQMTSTSYLGTAAVTIQFDLNRSIDGAANDVQARDQRRRRPVAEEPPLAADLPQGQPGGFADPAVVGDIGYAAADHRQRRRRRPARAADQPDFRRRPGHHRRPAEAGDPRPDRPGQARRQGPVAGRRAHPDRDHHRRQPEGQYRRRHTRLHHLRQRPVAGFQGLERRHHRLSQRRPVADPRYRPGRHRPGRRQAGGLGQRQARRVPGGLQAARRQRHRDRRQDQGDAAAAGRGDPARDQDRGHQRPHPDHSRRGRGRAVHPAPDHRAGGDGDLHLPAQLLGHRDPDRHGAAGAARRLRADVGVRLYARQSVADGADHRGRLRGRRRHRDAGKHHPLYRGRREAAGRRLQGRQRNRLHHRVDQRLAGRGADPAAADGRHHRAAVPRIRGDAGDDDLRVDGRVADADADDGLALPARAQRNQARPVLPMERARLRRHAARL